MFWSSEGGRGLQTPNVDMVSVKEKCLIQKYFYSLTFVEFLQLMEKNKSSKKVFWSSEGGRGLQTPNVDMVSVKEECLIQKYFKSLTFVEFLQLMEKNGFEKKKFSFYHEFFFPKSIYNPNPKKPNPNDC